MKKYLIFHIEKIALFYIFELQKRIFHSLDLNPSADILEKLQVLKPNVIMQKSLLLRDWNDFNPYPWLPCIDM